MAAVITTLFTTSCSSDDAPDLAAGVAGTFEGYSSMNSAYFTNMISVDQKVTISRLTDNTVSLRYESASTGTFTIPEATVVKGTDSYTLSGTGTTSMGHAGNTKDYDCSFTGTVSGDSRVFTFSIPAVMGGATVTFTAGELPEAMYGYVLAGTYTGTFTAKSGFFDGMVDDEESTVKVEAAADGKVTIKCSSPTWGEISIPAVEVKRDGKKFSAEGTGTNNMPGMNGGSREYVCEGTVERDVATDAVKVSFTMPAVMGGLTISFDAD